MQMEKAQVVWGRAEELLHEPSFRGHFDFVTAKGVGIPGLCLELGGGFLKEGGILVVKQSYDQTGSFPRFVLDKEVPIKGISGTKSKLLAFSKCST